MSDATKISGQFLNYGILESLTLSHLGPFKGTIVGPFKGIMESLSRALNTDDFEGPQWFRSLWNPDLPKSLTSGIDLTVP